jgi:hypothetical protein
MIPIYSVIGLDRYHCIINFLQKKKHFHTKHMEIVYLWVELSMFCIVLSYIQGQILFAYLLKITLIFCMLI